MSPDELAREARRQKRLERFGTNEPRCGTCGMDDDRCLELHHIAGRKHDEAMALVCRNCHRMLSDDQRDHPPAGISDDPTLFTIGRFLIGLADMLRIIIERLYAFGQLLIGRAALAVEGGAA